jgi:glycogen debranching enzyme
MPSEIKVTPPGLTISQGRTFMVTDQRGEIDPLSDDGVFAIDTRYVSTYKLFLNRQPWKLVNSSQISFYAARIHLTNPEIHTTAADIPADTLSLTIERSVGEGIHEDFSLTNYCGKPVRVVLELELHADFADIFEVRSGRFVQRGKLRTVWNETRHELRTAYTNQDFHRAVLYEFQDCEHTPLGYANGRLFLDIELERGREWHVCGEIALEHGQQVKKSIYGHRPAASYAAAEAGASVAAGAGDEPRSDFDERQARWQARCTNVLTPNEHVYRMYHQAVEDMGALRIYDLDVSDEAWVPAAGVPWFVTLFGRDSLIVSLQTMAVAPGFASGALARLAEYQAKERDDWRDAQPGKILHEIRFGELAHFHSIPFTPYYGTADATLLFPIVLSELYRWTGDITYLHRGWKAAEGCLRWMDESGDLDGDGFQEYQTYSPLGYENVGWKDSPEAVVYADGGQVKQPKGLCELQGYAYDAKLRMAEICTVLGDAARGAALRTQAEALKAKFNAAFWMEDEGCFAFGLDREKRQITSVVSNAGHCLWSGIADPEKARRTALRLLQPDMWSGWGIRTLSSHNPAFNPYAYHLGTVWPHDNGIIAAGMKRYGLRNEAIQVIRGIFDAARTFERYRPPEVFAGIARVGKKSDFPALYPAGANVPQAWASGSIFQAVQTLLGLRADAPSARLYVAPSLPPWLPDITLRGLQVGTSRIDLRFWREGERSRWALLDQRDATPASPTSPASPGTIEVLDDPECASG